MDIKSLKRKKRVLKDVERLVARNMEVRIGRHRGNKHDLGEFYVKIHGPVGTLYAEGSWYIRLTIPQDYPIKSPSVGFNERVWHPNICYESGSVCLNALNHDWSPVYNLEKVTQDLKVLLSEPNFDDPLNTEAAKLYQENKAEYERRVKKVLEESQEAISRHAPGELVSRDVVMKRRKSLLSKPRQEQPRSVSRSFSVPTINPSKATVMEVDSRLRPIEQPFSDPDLALSEPDDDSDEYDEEHNEIEFVEIDDRDF